jgi:predicted nucleotidyltransferase
MSNTRDVNIQMITTVARRLGNLREKVVFVGGCATGLFITDPAMPEVRVTKDVDVIIDIATRMEYSKLEADLRSKGFRNDISEDAPLCRWLVNDIKVDVMPTQEDIIGFSNHWYLPAIENANYVQLEKELTIKLVTPPYFLATKIEAFKGRGKGDYLASHDMEDIITILDGRLEIIDEIKSSSDELKTFLSTTFQIFLADENFLDAIPGQLLPDRASQARLPRLIKLLEEIAKTM